VLGVSETHVGSDKYAGTAYVIGGNSALGGTDVLLADATIEGDEGAQTLGFATTVLADQDGDGFADVVLGARSYSTGSTNVGAAYLFYGSLSGGYVASDADASWVGTTSGASVGTVVDSADLTGDGYLDLAIGAEGASEPDVYAGAVFIVPGAP
jgi:hypothetical protein